MRPCLEPGCPMLVYEGRCPAHRRGGGWIGAGKDYGSAWPRIRARVLAEEPTCRLRLAGCTTYSTQVDHIVPKSRGGTDERGNLRAVCKPCHQRKTQDESATGKRLKR